PAAPAQRPVGSRRVGNVLAICLACAATLAGAEGGSPATSQPVAQPVVQPVAQPMWRELSEAQREILQPFAGQWNSLSSSEKRSWVVLAERLPRMDAEARQRARHRIGEWAELTPEQRRIARMNYRIASQLSPEERKAQWERYATLTSEQQRVLRTSGWTSNTAARHAGARTGLAKEAAQPLTATPTGRPPATAQPATDP
ncbi:MAG TPA: DUF3106 domain-containing protein, partial [Burkholderiaceae bacterium]|nr:DUF3106 domain-containing protein [Burkholderiaceae bacterium]